MKMYADGKNAPNLSAWKVDEHDFPHSGSRGEQMRFLVRYGELAANSHNTQPWLFQVRDEAIGVYWDATRALRLSDPIRRQGTISLGCALGNLVVAAEYFGLTPRVTYGQDSAETDPVATVHLEKAAGDVSLHARLFPALAERRMNRFPYTRRPIEADTLASLRTLTDVEGVSISFVSDALLRDCMLSVVYHSTVGTQGNAQIVREWAAWMRPRNTTRYDGIPLTEDFGFPGALSLIAPLVWSMTPGKVQAKNTQKLFSTAPVFFVISGPDTQTGWLRTGQALTYLGLAATQAHIAYAPWGAVVEHQPSADLVRDVLHLSERVLFFGRLGYSMKVPPVHTPRRPLEDVLREGTYAPHRSVSTEAQV